MIQLIKGDITQNTADAIVNAANTRLLGGGGVDGAIHDAAGSLLLEECRSIGGCPTGEARITKGYNLSAKYVIHAVGPIWGEGDEELKLRETIRGCFILAGELAIHSISFPAISTGIYRFPCGKAAQVFKEELFRFFKKNPQTGLHLVRMVVFDAQTLQTFLEEFHRTDE